MRNKLISFLLMIVSIFLFAMSIKSGINVIKGESAIGNFFATMFITNSLAVIFAIISGYLTLKNSKKLNMLSKKTCIFIVSFSVFLIIAMMMTTTSSVVDKVIVMGNFKKLVCTFLITDIFALILGFSAGVFLTRIVNKNIVIEKKTMEAETKRASGNTYRYIASFLIPIVGYVLGAILLSKNDEMEKTAGKNCIILGLVSSVISVVATVIIFIH